jgi:hypothetical protein
MTARLLTDVDNTPLAVVHVVRLPLPPTRANARVHWRQYDKDKRAYWSACDAATLALRPPQVPHTGIVWRADLGVASRYDADNLAALLKWPLDWLVSRRWWHDDDWRTAWPSRWPTQMVAPQQDRHVTVTWTAGHDLIGGSR